MGGVVLRVGELLCLGEQHQHARAPLGFQGVALFVSAMGHCQAVAGFVVKRFAIDQEHEVVGAVALDVVEGDVPSVEDAVAGELDALPAGE